MDLPESACTPLLASPPHKLGKVQHERHHDCNLQSMKEIYDSSAAAAVHHTRANVENCSYDHRPASGTNDGR